jgi:hypothetical protein
MLNHYQYYILLQEKCYLNKIICNEIIEMFVKQNDNKHYIYIYIYFFFLTITICIVHSKIIEKYFCNTTLITKMYVINNLLNQL